MTYYLLRSSSECMIVFTDACEALDTALHVTGRCSTTIRVEEREQAELDAGDFSRPVEPLGVFRNGMRVA